MPVSQHFLKKNYLRFLRRKFNRKRFDLATRGIYSTPPVICDNSSSLVILSQCRHADVTMLVIAAKSISKHVTPNHFVVIDDGLSKEDRRKLNAHLGNIVFINSSDVDVGNCPRGGTWERLITISKYSNSYYVIQLDSDILAISSPVEVQECITANRCFTLATPNGQKFVSVTDASNFAQQIGDNHVQILGEQALCSLPNSAQKRYVRGCSGFTGFGQNQVSMNDVESFSCHMEKAIGRDNWWKWGSEQVTSNFLISNSQYPMVLPFQRYPYWKPNQDLSEARIIHFIGEFRFREGMYIRKSRDVIQSLK